MENQGNKALITTRVAAAFGSKRETVLGTNRNGRNRMNHWLTRIAQFIWYYEDRGLAGFEYDQICLGRHYANSKVIWYSVKLPRKDLKGQLEQVKALYFLGLDIERLKEHYSISMHQILEWRLELEECHESSLWPVTWERGQ